MPAGRYCVSAAFGSGAQALYGLTSLKTVSAGSIIPAVISGSTRMARYAVKSLTGRKWWVVKGGHGQP